MKINLYRAFLPFILGALPLALAPYAHATAELELISGGQTVTIVDGGANDLSALPGVVEYSGSVGSFDVNVTTGFTYPQVGSTTQPALDISSANISGGTGTLTILFSQTGFGPVDSALDAQIGGTVNSAGGTVTFSTYDDSGNGIFTETTNLTNEGPFGSGAFSGSAVSGIVNLSNPFSLTEQIVVTHSAGGETSFDAELNNSVPDGASTLALLGLALVGIEGIRRKITAA